MTSFDFQSRTRIVFGPGKIDTLGELASELGSRRAFVVSDPGVVAAGHTERGIRALERAGIKVKCFSEVHENPTTVDVDAALQIARRHDCELLVGLGGGSSMDCAKGVNFLLSNGGEMRDYWGVGKALRPMLPMIAVPTTAGTGSETQSFALISDAQTKVKMACGDKKAACRIALLDPQLTVTQPRRITALTGVDAIAHAIETYVTKPRNQMSLTFSREAWRLLSANFPSVISDPNDISSRSGMQLGSCFAGLAIENSMLGATHALANPLTAGYGLVHGEAIGIMLPHVIRFNGLVVGELYREMMLATDPARAASDPQSGTNALAEFVTDLVREASLAIRLSELKVPESELADLAESAASQWTAAFNPRDVSKQDLLELYLQAF